jgi:hypothetical protein
MSKSRDTVEALRTVVVDADIGTSVQGYDATIVVDADIGSTVQAYDATILVDADIGVSVQAYSSDAVVSQTQLETIHASALSF